MIHVKKLHEQSLLNVILFLCILETIPTSTQRIFPKYIYIQFFIDILRYVCALNEMNKHNFKGLLSKEAPLAPVF